ncbi:glycosyltransferase family 2 protein [Aliivibrio fischeri]|uniref:glycosyltransferase family 2 protein n=1 Tax=Aliivibrio fischeri TaxID=668 RepID=UPI0007C5C4C6|nr:glycosyltransferase family 2 protein [Aliivibrio fischeri]
MSPVGPLVSIIMPAYNSENFIIRAISSVISQTYPHWELIIIDDASSDNTVSLVSNINDIRIKLIKLDKNTGSPSGPRNVGLDIAKGDYIAFLDSDDVWYKDKLYYQVNYMKDNKVDFTCTGYDLIKNNEIISTYSPPSFVGYNNLLLNNSVGCLTAMINKSILNDIRFPVCGHEDYALWLKLLRENNCSVYGIKKKLAGYSLLENSVSSNKFKMISFFWNIYRVEEKLSIFQSLYCCLRYFINVMWFKYK